LNEYEGKFVNAINYKYSKKKEELDNTNLPEKDKGELLKQYIEKEIANIKSEEFDTSLVSLPREVKSLDPETKVKIYDSSQPEAVVESIMKDYEQGEQIILQGHSAGGGDVQDVAEELNDRGVGNVITVQIDSIEPFGDDASIPANVTKAVNVYQKESKTGNATVDYIDSDAMNGEDKVHQGLFNNKTEVINKEIKNVTGPSQGLVNSPHRNIDDEPVVQKFTQYRYSLRTKVLCQYFPLPKPIE